MFLVGNLRNLDILWDCGKRRHLVILKDVGILEGLDIHRLEVILEDVVILQAISFSLLAFSWRSRMSC